MSITTRKILHMVMVKFIYTSIGNGIFEFVADEPYISTSGYIDTKRGSFGKQSYKYIPYFITELNNIYSDLESQINDSEND